MQNYLTLILVIEVLLFSLPTLLIVAFVRIAERKTMGSMQRRLEPNVTPCEVSLKSQISFLSGLCLFICTEEFNKWLSLLINSLDRDFSLQYCLNILKDISNINQIEKESAIFTLLVNSINLIIHPVTDLTFFVHLFSERFLSSHDSLYGSNYVGQYYNILHDLYLNYTDLFEYNVQLHEAYDELMEFFDSSLRTDFLTAYFASNDFAGDVTLHPDFTSRLETFNRLRIIFLDIYNNYRNSVLTVHNGLQQIQTMNPNFTLSLPSFNPIRVTPQEWFILDTIEGSFAWDPVIFQYDNFSLPLLDSLYALAATVNHQPLDLINNLFSSYNRTRQTLSTLPFNDFAGPNSTNLFEIEIQERRSRARTRRETRDLPSDMARTRSRSRSGSFSD